MNLLKAIMNKDETEKAIKLLKKAIKEDYLCKSEVQEFYELFRENKVDIFLETGELFSCNKRNAERLIESLKEDVKKYKRKQFLQAVKIATLIIGLLTALLELFGVDAINILQQVLTLIVDSF